jgi:hypothetical protein
MTYREGLMFDLRDKAPQIVSEQALVKATVIQPLNQKVCGERLLMDKWKEWIRDTCCAVYTACTIGASYKGVRQIHGHVTGALLYLSSLASLLEISRPMNQPHTGLVVP